MAGIRYEPLNSSGEELHPLIRRNEKTLVNRDFSPGNLCCNSRIALVFLKTQPVTSEHAISRIENEITQLRTSVWWLWMNSILNKKLTVSLGLVFTR